MQDKQKNQHHFALFSSTTNLTVQAPDVHGRHESRIEEYLWKSTILKQIMSNKARKYRLINYIQNILTVVVSSLLLFIGFSGLPKIQTYVSWVYPVGSKGIELSFNMLVFLIFLIGILHLVFQFFQKQANAEKAIASLAALGNEIEDMVTSRGNLVISEEPARVDLIRARYEAIAENAPANSDREFIQAKLDIAKKEVRRPSYSIKPQQLFESDQQKKIVSSIALGSRSIVDVLIALRDTDESLYLGGGLIRNAVWDYLHGYASPTPVDDVDVIYFQKTKTAWRWDEEYNDKLAKIIPNVQWSTKNQARMHTANQDRPYKSLDDAIMHWPETATAFVVRLCNNGTLEFVSPFGFDDLLRLLVRNTPAFASKTDIIQRRIDGKHWRTIWPALRIILSPS